MPEPAEPIFKKEILAVLQSLLDRGEEKIPAAIIREALKPYLPPAAPPSDQVTFPHIDKLNQVLQEFKNQTVQPEAAITSAQSAQSTASTAASLDKEIPQ